MSERIKGLSIGLSMEDLGVSKSLTKFKSGFKDLNSALKVSDNNFKYSEKTMKSYKDRTTELSKAVDNQRTLVKGLSKRYEELEKEGRGNSEEASKLRQEYNKQANNLNRLEHQLGSAKKEMDEFAKSQRIANSGWTKMGKMMDKQGDRFMSVGRSTQKAGRTITKATSIATATVTGFGASLFALTKKAASTADAINTSSKQLGVSTDYYQQMDYWASQNGLSQQDMEKAVGRLNQRLGMAVAGNEKYADILKELGISLPDVESGQLSTEDAMAKSVQALSEVENGQKKAAMTSELFGTKLARQLLPALEEGSLSIDEAKEKAKELGLVMSKDQIEAAAEFEAAQDDIKRSLSAITTQIGLDLMPKMQEFLEWILTNIPKIKNVINESIEEAINKVKDIAHWWSDLNTTLKRAIGISAAIVAALGPFLIILGKVSVGLGALMKAGARVLKFLGKNGLRGAVTQVASKFTFFLGPIGAVIAILSSLGIAFYQAYTKSESFRGFINGLGDKIKSAWGWIEKFKDAIANIFKGDEEKGTNLLKKLGLDKGTISTIANVVNEIKTTVTQAFEEVKQTVENLINGIVKFFKEDGRQILEAFKNIFGGIKAFVDFIMPGIKVAFKVGWTIIKTTIKAIWESIKNVVEGGLKIIKGIIQLFSGIFTGDFEKMWEGVKNIFFGALKVIWELIQIWLAGKVVKIVFKVLSKLKGFFKEGLNTIKEWFFKALNWIVKWVRVQFKKKIRSVKRSMQSIKDSIRDSMKAVQKNISKVWNFILKFFRVMLKKIWRSIKNRFYHIKNNIVDTWKFIKDSVVNTVKDLWSSISNTFTKMRDGLKKIIDKIKGFIGGMVDAVKDGVNKLIDGINWVAEKIGMDKIDPINFHTGTVHNETVNRKVKTTSDGALKEDTLATVGDRGPGNGPGGYRREIIEYPNGKMALTPNRDIDVYLPKGSKVHNGAATYQFLKDTMKPRFSTGTLFGQGGSKNKNSGLFDGLGESISNGLSKVADTGKKAWQGAKSLGKKATKVIGDVWEYATNPGKLVDKVLDTFGFDFGSLKGSLIKDLVKTGYNKLKKGIKSLFTGWLEDSGGGDGSSFTKFAKTTPYSPNSPVPGYPTSFNGGRHFGIDYATPVGTILKAPNSGKVSELYDRGGGIVAKLLTGKFTQFFMHLSKVLKTGNVKRGEAFAKTGNSGAWTTGPHLHYQVEEGNSKFITNKNTVDPEKYLAGSGGGQKKPASKWRSTIISAAKKMKVSPTKRQIDGIIAQIHRESGGDAGVTQSRGVWDINMAKGTPAQGLLQFVPSTFKAFAVKGHKNINSGFDQLLAFFNNTNWKNDIEYGRSGWGPRGSRRFATGGRIANSGWYNIAEKGFPEWIIPTDPKHASNAMMMLDMAAQEVSKNTQDNKRPHQLGGFSRSANTDVLEQKLDQMIDLLTHLAKSNNVIANKEFGFNSKEMFEENNKQQVLAEITNLLG